MRTALIRTFISGFANKRRAGPLKSYDNTKDVLVLEITFVDFSQ